MLLVCEKYYFSFANSLKRNHIIAYHDLIYDGIIAASSWLHGQADLSLWAGSLGTLHFQCRSCNWHKLSRYGDLMIACEYQLQLRRNLSCLIDHLVITYEGLMTWNLLNYRRGKVRQSYSSYNPSLFSSCFVGASASYSDLQPNFYISCAILGNHHCPCWFTLRLLRSQSCMANTTHDFLYSNCSTFLVRLSHSEV